MKFDIICIKEFHLQYIYGTVTSTVTSVHAYTLCICIYLQPLFVSVSFWTLRISAAISVQTSLYFLCLCIPTNIRECKCSECGRCSYTEILYSPICISLHTLQLYLYLTDTCRECMHSQCIYTLWTLKFEYNGSISPM